jgi:hypothetical protein
MSSTECIQRVQSVTLYAGEAYGTGRDEALVQTNSPSRPQTRTSHSKTERNEPVMKRVPSNPTTTATMHTRVKASSSRRRKAQKGEIAKNYAIQKDWNPRRFRRCLDERQRRLE